MTAQQVTTAGLRTVTATRYVLPLREGGSLPALLEADDEGTYVVKFRGAGQGIKALVAEVVVGELARALDLPVPDLVLVELAAELSKAEPDPEIQDLLRNSAGLNVGLDYLPGSLTLDSSVDPVDADLAARVLWFDALVENVDRSWRNPNLLVWHGRPYLIDHGAALYVHHSWRARETSLTRPYDGSEHTLLRLAGPLPSVDADLAARLTPDVLRRVVDLVPADWLASDPAYDSAEQAADAYVEWLAGRLAHRTAWLEPLEVTRAGAR